MKHVSKFVPTYEKGLTSVMKFGLSPLPRPMDNYRLNLLCLDWNPRFQKNDMIFFGFDASMNDTPGITHYRKIGSYKKKPMHVN